MKKLWGLVSILFVSSFIAYAPAHAQPASAATGVEEAGPESLLFAEIPVVYSASKEEQPLTKAPSVMTVYTDKDIRKMGARTLNDVLKRTVGFYTTSSVDWETIDSRGIGADMNHLYLFLIDGHSINSVNGWGPQNQEILPTLSDVARIEIIRGPGSTMWGTDAVMGTINIITKEGAAVKGIQTSVDYTTVEQQEVYNVMLGDETASGVNYMGSVSWFQTRGWEGVTNKDHKTWPSNMLYQPGVGGRNTTSDMDNFDNYEPSYELYGKVKFNGFTFLARQLHFGYQEPWRNRPSQTVARTLPLNDSFIDLAYLKQFDETMSLNTKLFGDFISKGRDVTNGSAASGKYLENGWGFDSSLSKALSTFGMMNHIQTGVRVDVVNIGPNTQASYNADSGINTTALTSNYLLTNGGVDRTYGVYAEDQVDITDKLSLVGGLRFDYDTLRYKGSALIPRGALIYKITDNWTAKYMYNSGEYLPGMNHSNRLPATATDTIRDAKDPLKSQDHDFQVMYNDAKTTVSIDAFHMRLKQFIANYDVAVGTLEAGYMNMGDFSTAGIELDARRKIIDKVSIYGNYSYAKATLKNCPVWSFLINKWVDENGHLLDMPRDTYNLGLDWECLKNCNWNFHMRGWGWAKMPKENAGNASNTTFDWRPGHAYFDTTFLCENIFVFTKPITLSVTCRNIFDSRGDDPYAAGNMTWLYEEGRTFDFRVTFKF